MSFRKCLLAASVSLTTVCAMAQTSWAGTVTFDTTTGTFDIGDGNSSFFGNPTVTSENGVRVFTFDEVVMNSDTIDVVGNAPLIIRSRTNMLVINTDVNVQAGQAGGGREEEGQGRGQGGGRLYPRRRPSRPSLQRGVPLFRCVTTAGRRKQQG